MHLAHRDFVLRGAARGTNPFQNRSARPPLRANRHPSSGLPGPSAASMIIAESSCWRVCNLSAYDGRERQTAHVEVDHRDMPLRSMPAKAYSNPSRPLFMPASIQSYRCSCQPTRRSVLDSRGLPTAFGNQCQEPQHKCQNKGRDGHNLESRSIRLRRSDHPVCVVRIRGYRSRD